LPAYGGQAEPIVEEPELEVVEEVLKERNLQKFLLRPLLLVLKPLAKYSA